MSNSLTATLRIRMHGSEKIILAYLPDEFALLRAWLADIAIGKIRAALADALVDLFVIGDLVMLDRGALLRLEVVQPRVVAAENCGFHRPLGWAERLVVVFLL